jgi:hypothetical protein
VRTKLCAKPIVGHAGSWQTLMVPPAMVPWADGECLGGRLRFLVEDGDTVIVSDRGDIAQLLDVVGIQARLSLI